MTPHLLQEEIDAVTGVLSKLKAHRNTVYAPVSRLPPEVLVRIFSICASGDIPFRLKELPLLLKEPSRRDRKRGVPLPSPSLPPREQTGWINFTHVCHYWRSVALDSAALWATFDNRQLSHHWLREMLFRSSQAPLSMTLSTTSLSKDVPNVPKDLDDLIVAQLPRTRHLQLYDLVEDTCPMRCFKQLTDPSNHAPWLESLELSAYSQYDAPFLHFDLHPTKLPVLRTLDLVGCSISWTSPILDQLVHLKVDSSFSPTALELYAVFQRMHVLETIVVTVAKPPPSEISAFPTVISMPHLVRTHITGDERSCLDLTSHLNIHPASSTKVTVSNSEVHPFMHPILEAFGGASNPPRALLLRSGGKLYDSHTKSSSDLVLWNDNDKADLYHAFRYTSSYYHASLCPFVPSANFHLQIHHAPVNCASSPWQGLWVNELVALAVQLKDDNVWAKQRWLSTFKDASQIKTIVARGDRAALSLLNALAPAAPSDGALPAIVLSDKSLPFLEAHRQQSIYLPLPELPDTVPDILYGTPEADTLLFPALETIVLQTDSLSYWSRGFSLNHVAFFEAFAAALETRRTQGAPSLNLVQIPYFDEDRAIVTQVVNRLKKGARVKVVKVDDLSGRKFVAKRAAPSTDDKSSVKKARRK
ncbi:hypothetical protein BV25DRAFT_1921941 [Artomyces pyxidatus]|uniref:Uncharacterized protein n=1 Tax=Artomyces pyxidatus TaxID=48021 RepID=A0ACB8SGB4_9AGAM|nr:hypothetical protein BV25DRAFT_1921941 [Artomyces pyxidatus]